MEEREKEREEDDKMFNPCLVSLIPSTLGSETGVVAFLFTAYGHWVAFSS